MCLCVCVCCSVCLYALWVVVEGGISAMDHHFRKLQALLGMEVGVTLHQSWRGCWWALVMVDGEE